MAQLAGPTALPVRISFGKTPPEVVEELLGPQRRSKIFHGNDRGEIELSLAPEVSPLSYVHSRSRDAHTSLSSHAPPPTPPFTQQILHKKVRGYVLPGKPFGPCLLQHANLPETTFQICAPASVQFDASARTPSQEQDANVPRPRQVSTSAPSVQEPAAAISNNSRLGSMEIV